MTWLIYGMVYLGSALMVYNVFSYVRYAQNLQKKEDWGKERNILYIPIVLLILFLLGYLAVGIFGKPDLIISGILFGGSIFVFIIFYLLQFITARVQENEHLEAKLLAVQESNKTKNAILSSVSHEMRTPMNAIIGLDFIALKDPDLKPITRRQFEKIDENARHLMALIDNILDMSDIDAGHIQLRQEIFSLQILLDNINVILRAQCLAKELFYSSAVVGRLDDYYVGDQGKLRQVLLSILDNAVKYTQNGSGTVTFITEQIESTEQNRILRFIISDTGIGMDKEFLSKVFDVFTQENTSATDRYGGIGVSLAVSHKLVELMGGKIEISSDKGIGSTFMVTVKLGKSDRKAAPKLSDQFAPVAIPEDYKMLNNTESNPADEDVISQKNEEDHPDGIQSVEIISALEENSEKTEKNPPEKTLPTAEVDDSSQKNGIRVLIAEDVDLNAEILADLLEMDDISSDRAINGEVALQMFSDSPENYYDAVLMDLRMPVMDGLESARRIRELDRADAAGIPIIALSANASYDDRQNVEKAGMDFHLSKPVDSELLYETLERLVNRHRKTA